MTCPFDLRPPCMIRVEEIGTNQYAAISDVDGDLSGCTNWVNAVARAIEQATSYGDGVIVAPYEGFRYVLMRPEPACLAWEVPR